MQETKNWDSLQTFFSVLNENVEYLVLRNFEEFVEGIFNVDHPDIDILCRDSKELIHFAECTTRTGNHKDLIHQKILIGGKSVALDIRHVGDGYYDESWEKDMLRKRRLINNLCYVMDEENYYYSLLYHALVQKKTLSNDYQIRLETMAIKLFDETKYSPVSLEMLQSYMREKGYRFTYPEYLGGIANFDQIDKNLIKADRIRCFRKFIFILNRKINKIIR